MNAPLDLRMDKATFLHWMQTQRRRYELIEGRVVMQDTGTRGHSSIGLALYDISRPRLDRMAWTVHVGQPSVEIGDDVDGVETAKVAVRVTGGAGTFLQLWRDGEELEQIEITSDDFRHTFEDRPGAADRRYRVEVITDANQRLVITSHIYVRGVAGSGCGCHGGSGALAGIAPVLLLLRRRRRR